MQSWPDDYDLDYWLQTADAPLASLADWFDLVFACGWDSEYGPQGQPILWSTTVKTSRISETAARHVSADTVAKSNLKLANEVASAQVLDGDFRFSKVTVETEFGEVAIQRPQRGTLTEGLTEISCGQTRRTFAGCISTAWLVDSGRAIVFLTYKREYWVLTGQGLTSFGSAKVVGPAQWGYQPCYVPESGRLFLIFPQGEVFEVLPPDGIKGYYLPVFPTEIWSEIDSLSRTMLPSDLCESDANFQYVRLPDPELEGELAGIMSASGYGTPQTRVLKHLINLGLHNVRDVFDGDPDKFFPTGSHRYKSRKVALSLIATEIRKAYPSDPLGLELNLTLRGLVERGWPALENSDPAIRTQRYRVDKLEKDLGAYASKLDGKLLPVRHVKASPGSPNHIELILEGGVIVTVDQGFNAVEVFVPFWRSDSVSSKTECPPISHSRFGPKTLELLANYAGVLEGRDFEDAQGFPLPGT